MNRKSKSNVVPITRRTFATSVAAAGIIAGVAPFNIGRAQGGPLKVGVLLPRSGFEAGIGEDCQRSVDVAPAIFKSMGLPEPARGSCTTTVCQINHNSTSKVSSDLIPVQPVTQHTALKRWISTNH